MRANGGYALLLLKICTILYRTKDYVKIKLYNNVNKVHNSS